MKSKLSLVIALWVFCFGSTAGFAQDIEFSGGTATELGLFVQGEKAGHFSNARQSVMGNLDVRFDSCRVYIQGLLEFDGIKAFNGDRFSLTNGLTASLQEAYFTWTSNDFGPSLNFSTTIGRQLISFGKADGISITDAVFPKRLDAISFSPLDASKLHLDAWKFSLGGMIFNFDIIYQPFFTATSLPLSEGNELKKHLIPESVSLPGLTNAIGINVGSLKQPELKFINGNVASVLSFYLPRVDFSFYGWYGFDTVPVLNYVPEMTTPPIPDAITVNGDYQRYGLLGFDAALPISQVVLRFETAYSIAKALQVDAVKILQGEKHFERKHLLKMLLGLDWTYKGLTLTTQYYGDVVFGGIEQLTRKRYEHGTTLSLSYAFLQDTLSFGVNYAINWNEFDSFLRANMSYDLTDAISLGLSYSGFFPGKSQGEYGRYKDLSDVKLEAVFRW